jgi:hypothetical protein
MVPACVIIFGSTEFVGSPVYQGGSSFIGTLVFTAAASIKRCIRNVAFVLWRERLRS